MNSDSLLSTFAFNGKVLEIHRTRERDTLIQAMKSLDTFVIDVGRVHDPARLNFDHHQNDLAASWEDGLPMSSCGLIWSWLKEEGYLASLNTPNQTPPALNSTVRPSASM